MLGSGFAIASIVLNPERQVEGLVSEMVIRVAGAFSRSTTLLIIIGMSTLFLTIDFLLLDIVRWL